jgi:5'-nucleotidase
MQRLSNTTNNILLSNDDGVHAQGLCTLRNALNRNNISNVIVAPDRDRSGASNSLTLDRPLHPVQVDENTYGINGTPTDAVHLALNSLYNGTIERVISGINSGANLGDDVIYSGTVAAAMEGRFLQKIAVAVSVAGSNNFETAANIICDLLPKLDQLDLALGTLLNINVPDVPEHEIKGIKITRLGHRERSEYPIHMLNPRGKDCYWIAKAGEGKDCDEGTDFYALEHGYVSITPVTVDMTDHKSVKTLEDWLSDKH